MERYASAPSSEAQHGWLVDNIILKTSDSWLLLLGECFFAYLVNWRQHSNVPRLQILFLDVDELALTFRARLSVRGNFNEILQSSIKIGVEFQFFEMLRENFMKFRLKFHLEFSDSTFSWKFQIFVFHGNFRF